MRTVLAATLAFVGVSVCWAQSPGPDAAVQEALSRLRTAPQLWLRLDGTESVGASVVPFATDLFWSRSYTPQGQLSAKIEMRTFRSGALVSRVVGDGTTFWRHDVKANTYAAKRYGGYDGSAPSGYMADLLRTVTSVAEGPDAYLARLLRETHGGGMALFTRWMPADLSPTLLTTGSVDDPFARRTYSASPGLEYALYDAGLPGSDRFLAFELPLDTNERAGRPQLRAIYYSDRSVVGRRERIGEWVLAVYPNALPDSADFTFQIPKGARPIPLKGAGG